MLYFVHFQILPYSLALYVCLKKHKYKLFFFSKKKYCQKLYLCELAQQCLKNVVQQK